MLFAVVCYQSLLDKARLWLKFTITASGTESKKEWIFGGCELNMRFMRIKTWSRAIITEGGWGGVQRHISCLRPTLGKSSRKGTIHFSFLQVICLSSWGSLSCLACWQLLIIRGLARAFLACGKVWGLEPHEQFSLHVSARGSVNLFSTQLKLSWVAKPCVL